MAKGKKIERFAAVRDEKDAILKSVMGPSGNLRAPAYRVGKSFVVGFHADFYAQWLA